jgi:1-acyl-sn-glycerol-3-phosphate acyltransferase
MSTSHTLDSPPIPARHHALGDALLYWGLVRPALWSHFDRVWIKVEGAIPQASAGPLIVYMNHPSWWDGYIAFVLNRLVLRNRFQGYAMMEEQQLKRYRFFSWSGAFSVHRQDARSAMRSVRYIGRLLAERRNRCLYIFPQGEIAPNDRRPLQIFSGAAHIARRAGGATLWPVALRYEFRGEQRAEIFIRTGPPHHTIAGADTRALTGEIGSRLTAACDALRDEYTAGDLGGYRVLLRGRAGINRVFDTARGMLPRR